MPFNVVRKPSTLKASKIHKIVKPDSRIWKMQFRQQVIYFLPYPLYFLRIRSAFRRKPSASENLPGSGKFANSDGGMNNFRARKNNDRNVILAISCNSPGFPLTSSLRITWPKFTAWGCLGSREGTPAWDTKCLTGTAAQTLGGEVAVRIGRQDGRKIVRYWKNCQALNIEWTFVQDCTRRDKKEKS